jgi:hypothetical protein
VDILFNPFRISAPALPPPIYHRHALSTLPRRPQRLHQQRSGDGGIREDPHLGRLPLHLAPGYRLLEGAPGQPAPVQRVSGVLNGIAVADRVVAHELCHYLRLPYEVPGNAPADEDQKPSMTFYATIWPGRNGQGS